MIFNNFFRSPKGVRYFKDFLKVSFVYIRDLGEKMFFQFIFLGFELGVVSVGSTHDLQKNQ